MSTVKIYFGKNVLLLAENQEAEMFTTPVRLHHPSGAAITGMISQMQEGVNKEALITSDDPGVLLATISKHFRTIQAGGGIVSDTQGRVLLIFRRGKWDLPKGKLDAGETLEQCALREVQEETGLSNITVNGFFGVTRHVYEDNGQQALKETHWYAMDHEGDEPLLPQAEEDIEEAVWADPGALDRYLCNTYPSIADIFRKWKKPG